MFKVERELFIVLELIPTLGLELLRSLLNSLLPDGLDTKSRISFMQIHKSQFPDLLGDWSDSELSQWSQAPGRMESNQSPVPDFLLCSVLELGSVQRESLNSSVSTPKVEYNSSPEPGHRRILPWFQRIFDLARNLTWYIIFLRAWSTNLQPPFTIVMLRN